MYIAKRWGLGAALWTFGLYLFLKLWGVAISFTDFLAAAATLGVLTTVVVATFRRLRPPRWMSHGEKVWIGERVFNQNRARLLREARDGYVAICPRTRRIVVVKTQVEAIVQGTAAFGHRGFYVRPIDDARIPQIRNYDVLSIET